MTDMNRRDFLMAGLRTALSIGAAGAMAPMLAGCETMGEVSRIGADIAASAGVISQDQAASIARSGEAVARTFEEITPAQEYYIGRTVGAVILDQYPPLANPAANGYLNLLGQTLAAASDYPETYGGYHFLILDTDEINAFAAPGGLIFISTGLLACCPHETAVAGVCAHEIGHVGLKHGLRSISKARITTALTVIGAESARTFGGEDLATLADAFGGAVSDVTRTLVVNGYSRAYETDADMAAIAIMRRVGYDPNGLVDMLGAMDRRLSPGGAGFASTHPDPADRIARITQRIGGHRPVRPDPARQARFVGALGAMI